MVCTTTAFHIIHLLSTDDWQLVFFFSFLFFLPPPPHVFISPHLFCLIILTKTYILAILPTWLPSTERWSNRVDMMTASWKSNNKITLGLSFPRGRFDHLCVSFWSLTLFFSVFFLLVQPPCFVPVRKRKKKMVIVGPFECYGRLLVGTNRPVTFKSRKSCISLSWSDGRDDVGVGLKGEGNIRRRVMTVHPSRSMRERELKNTISFNVI